MKIKLLVSTEFRPLLQGALYTFTSIDEKQFCMSPVGVCPASDTAFSNAGTSTWTLPKHELSSIVAESIKQVPEVQSVFARFGDTETVIWTLLKTYNPVAREKVYEKELSICQTLHLDDVDFRVTSIDLVPPSELVDMGLREIYRRK